MYPLYSKRWLLKNLLNHFILNPTGFISKITPKRILGFFRVFGSEGTIGVYRIVNGHMTQKKIPKYTQELNILNNNDLFTEIESYKKLIFKNVENPDVSIIIPVYNKFNYTYNCLKSIQRQSDNKVSYEIIIADDFSDDITVEIDKIVSGINVVKTRENSGFLKNCNNAAKKAKGKYILFLNNDTQVQNNWLYALVELIERDSAIGAVGSKMVFENGMLLEAVGIVWNDATVSNYGRMGDPALPEYNYLKEVDYISGASLMIRKSVWEEVKYFDEIYTPAYYEDIDLCFSIRQKKYKVFYQPSSVVMHYEGISNGSDISKGQNEYKIKNKNKFYEKWKECLLRDQYPNGKEIFHARDRSRNKKTLLMIDRYVPMYDKDAGSVTCFQYLKLFVNLGYNVKFIGNDFIKHEPYTSVLEQMGIEVLYGVYYANNWKRWIKTNGMYIHYVYLNRPYVANKYINVIKKNTHAKILYYGHDLHYLRDRREYAIKNDKRYVQSSRKIKKIELRIMKKADMSYYPSKIEVDEIKKENPSINVKVIPAYLYEKKILEKRRFENTEGIVFIGGFDHKPNVDGILWYIREIYPVLNKNRPEINTYIIGSNVPEEIIKLNSENIIITGYVNEKLLTEYYIRCRLSIAPLRFGAGLKGKVIEAMYFQMPVITTSIGAEGINMAENYLLIKDDPLSFAEEILRVYDDLNLLSEISIKEIDIVNKMFTMSAAKKVILNDLTAREKGTYAD